MHLALPPEWWQLPQQGSCCLHHAFSSSSSHVFLRRRIQPLLNAHYVTRLCFPGNRWACIHFHFLLQLLLLLAFSSSNFSLLFSFILNGSLFLCSVMATDAPSLWAHFSGSLSEAHPMPGRPQSSPEQSGFPSGLLIWPGRYVLWGYLAQRIGLVSPVP